MDSKQTQSLTSFIALSAYVAAIVLISGQVSELVPDPYMVCSSPLKESLLAPYFISCYNLGAQPFSLHGHPLGCRRMRSFMSNRPRPIVKGAGQNGMTKSLHLLGCEWYQDLTLARHKA